MADSVSSSRRSEIMSHIKSKDTSIELLVRRKLFSMGYRYRVNYKALPGKPDIVFTRKKIAIFIHGCYWHGHDCGSHYAHASQSNKAYWRPKIERTKQRDQEHIQALEADGWKIIVLWKCEIRGNWDGTDNNYLDLLFEDILWGHFTLQDAIDFARYAVETTIQTMRFKNVVETVGGSVDILVITPDETRWLQKERLK